MQSPEYVDNYMKMLRDNKANVWWAFDRMEYSF